MKLGAVKEKWMMERVSVHAPLETKKNGEW